MDQHTIELVKSRITRITEKEQDWLTLRTVRQYSHCLIALLQPLALLHAITGTKRLMYSLKGGMTMLIEILVCKIPIGLLSWLNVHQVTCCTGNMSMLCRLSCQPMISCHNSPQSIKWTMSVFSRREELPENLQKRTPSWPLYCQLRGATRAIRNKTVSTYIWLDPTELIIIAWISELNSMNVLQRCQTLISKGCQTFAGCFSAPKLNCSARGYLTSSLHFKVQYRSLKKQTISPGWTAGHEVVPNGKRVKNCAATVVSMLAWMIQRDKLYHVWLKWAALELLAQVDMYSWSSMTVLTT